MSALEVCATVKADPDLVWRDWTESVALTTWFWPTRLEADATIDREAASWQVRSDIAGIGVTAKVHTWSEPDRLGLSWRWDGEEPETDVTVDFESSGEGTTVCVRQDGFTLETERDEHRQGWTDCLDRLVDRHRA